MDVIYQKAKELVIMKQKANLSLLQVNLNIGYIEASGLLKKLEEEGVISDFSGPGPRRVLLGRKDLIK